MNVFSKLDPYIGAAKLAGIGLAVLAIVGLAFSWSVRGQEIARLTDWQNTVVLATTAATVEPDAKGVRKTLKPEQVAAAIAGLKRTSDSCLEASAERDRITSEAVTRANNADKALANVQTIMRGEYSSAAKRIQALEQVKAQPTPALSCQQVGGDSKAAWEGWK